MSVDQWGREWKIDQEFGQDLVGQRVGWAAITEGDTYEGAFQANLVTTTISDQGAKIEREVLTEQDTRSDGQERTPRVKTEGFEDTIALTFVLGANDDEETRRFDTDVSWRAFDNDRYDLLQAADPSRNNDEELDKQRVWTDATALMPLLKAGLIERGQEKHYPVIYYTANVLVAHETLLEWSASRENRHPLPKPMPQYQLPDAAMSVQTAKQRALAEQVAAAYGLQVTASDELKSSLLTPAALDVYTQFVHNTSAAESTAQDARQNLAVWYNFMRLREDDRAFPANRPGERQDYSPLGKLVPGDIDALSQFNKVLGVRSEAGKVRQKHFNKMVYALGELSAAEAKLLP